MRFTKEKESAITNYILTKVSENSPDVVKHTSEAFDVTVNTVYRYLRKLIAEGVIEKTGRRYALLTEKYLFRYTMDYLEMKREDAIFREQIEPSLKDVPSNVVNIIAYAFSEMLNNAIDHSGASHVDIILRCNFLYTEIMILDDGVGIFHKIQDHFGFPTVEDAIAELFKGKLTTDSKRHSGEGIFFTSRLMDIFALVSDGKVFSHTNFDDIVTDYRNVLSYDTEYLATNGTIVWMKIANASNKTTKEIMDLYADINGGFTRTSVPIKNMFSDYPVSRSQAKRLTHRFENFEEITLDFSGVNEIGQGFAHELFVVFQNAHPNVQLLPVNTNRDVQRMIYHVTH